MSHERSAPRRLQQQPRRESDPQQQRAGATDFQPALDGPLEGRRYHNNLRDSFGQAESQPASREAKSPWRGER